MHDEDRFWDVFLCYKWEDAGAATALYAALEAEGLKVFQDVEMGEVWAPLADSLRWALKRSRTLVVLMTPRLPSSPHCREELYLALSAAYHLNDGDTSRVMVVVQGVSPDDVYPRQLTMFRLPRDNTPPDGLAREIARIVAKHEDRFGDAPDAPDPDWHPREIAGDRLFRGRWNELWEIHQGLRARSKNADRGHPVVAVSGPGGLGKTALSLQYARWYSQDHPGGVFLLRLGGSGPGARLDETAVLTAYRHQLTLVAKSLRLAGPDEVAAALADRAEPYLWIVDDVPATAGSDVIRELCAPTRAGRTLITTRGRLEGLVSLVVPLEPLDAHTGGRVLTAHRPSADGDLRHVRDIVHLLGGHPLGLTLAAGLTTLPEFTGYGKLLSELSATEPDRLEAVAAGLVDQLPAACARPFANALLRSFTVLGGEARDALTAASVLAPTLIPRNLLEAIAGRMSGGSPTPVDEAMDTAVGRGLIARAEADGWVMHALTARAIRVWISPAAVRTDLRNAALAALTEALEGTRESFRHAEILDFLPHVRAVAGLLPGGDTWTIGEDERHLLNEAGRAHIEAGHTGDALLLLQALHAACVGSTDLDVVTYHAVVVALAAAHTEEGDHTTALGLLERAVEVIAAELGTRHRDALTARNNLAIVHLKLGRPGRAHDLLREVYRARRQHDALGPTHRDTLIALNNLAIARGRLGSSPAERLRHRRVAHRFWTGAQERWRRIARPDDQYALDVLNGLALSYRALGMREWALEILADLHRLREGLLGPGHPDTLSAAENGLIIRCELGERPDGALEAILLGRLRSQGPGHHRTSATMRNVILTKHQAGAAAATAAAGQPAELPQGWEPEGVRLDGDHVDEELDLQHLAMDHQQECVDLFGSDDPRTLMATCYLAYSLAAADHIEGQVECAWSMMEDTWPGLLDAADAQVNHLGRHDLEIAELIRDWLRELTEGVEI